MPLDVAYHVVFLFPLGLLSEILKKLDLLFFKFVNRNLKFLSDLGLRLHGLGEAVVGHQRLQLLAILLLFV